MPISHKHRILFIHIPKTGGSSIEIALGMFANQPEVRPDILYGYLHGGHMQHFTLRELREKGLLTEEQRKTYFKFAIVRNPWERMLSDYFYLTRVSRELPSRTSFRQFVFEAEDKIKQQSNQHLRPQIEYLLGENGAVGVDYLGRFEDLQGSFIEVCRRAQIDQPALQHINRSKHWHYSHYYDEQTREKVRQYYLRDIVEFGYEFEEQSTMEWCAEAANRIIQPSVKFLRQLKYDLQHGKYAQIWRRNIGVFP